MATALAAAGAAPTWATGNMSAAPVEQLRFTVLLDGKPIGSHDFTVAGVPDEALVRSRASFTVTLLRIPVYRYEHEDQESWHQGCLARMEAHTHDNGQESQVSGELTGQGFEVRGPQGAVSLTGCVKSFAYWDKRFLSEHRLLNAQTGAYEPVQVTLLGTENIGPPAHRVAAEHYALVSGRLHLELWYSAGGNWLALESRTEQGHLLRYELH